VLGRRLQPRDEELMLCHAFRFVDRVVLIVGPQNLRSQKALEKIGGLRAGRRQGSSGRESLVYEIRASAFQLRSQS